ncbi:MAG: hypothetical protein GY851_31420, partial [bacterium]|nr:hypothetical protein [bacterium]
LMAAAFVVLGLVRSWLAGQMLPWFFAVASVFLVAGIVVPSLLRPVFVAWMKLAEVLNWIMTRVMLSLVFYLMIVPARFINQWRGNDPLKRDWDLKSESYWEDAEEQPDEFERYLNQF